MMLQWLASSEWANVVKALLHTLWQGVVIAVLLGIALRQLKNPVARYRCALAALGAVVFAGLVGWAVLNRPVARPVASSPPGQTQTVVSSVSHNSPPAPVVNITDSEPSFSGGLWTAWLALAWLAGATMMVGRAAVQVAGAERLRRGSRPLQDERISLLLTEARQAVGLARRVQIAVTDQLTSPAVVGVLWPTLILPLSLATTLTPEQIRFVLLHELAHIRRGDYFANLFQLFAEALLFFNPAVWWISRQMRIEREACCDALAIELSGAPADYARTLVYVAENILTPAPGAAPAFGEERDPSSLADRVQRMLVPGYRPKLRLTWRSMLFALLTGSGLLFLSAVGTRFTVAAILSPQQRIDRIERKMAEYGVIPEANAPGQPGRQVNVTAQLRTPDGSPLPKQWSAVVWSLMAHGSAMTSAWPFPGKKGLINSQMSPGQIWIEADVQGYAPALVGPLDGYRTNRIDAGEVVLSRGFAVTIRVTDADTGAAIPNAKLHAQFIVRDNGNYFQDPRDLKADGAGVVNMPLCIDQQLAVSVNAPGYEIYDQHFDHLSAGQTLEMRVKSGAILAGAVVDKSTGRGIAGATVRVVYEKGQATHRYNWDDALRVLAQTDADGHFAAKKLHPGTVYWLGVSAPGHETLVVERVSPGVKDLTVKLGPELVVRGRVIGKLDSLVLEDSGRMLDIQTDEKYDNDTYGISSRVPVKVQNGLATFQFTNHVAGSIWLSGGPYREEREVTAPIDDWVVDLTKAKKAEAQAKAVPKREVIFHFKSPSGVSPRGIVAVTVPDNLDKNNLTAHVLDLEITNGEVRADISIGGVTSIQPKHLVGYWFNQWTVVTAGLPGIMVTNGEGPMMVEVPVIEAGAVYAKARNADGSPFGGLTFGVFELKRAPGRSENNSLEGGVSDGLSSIASPRWVSGALPLGGTYQIYAWRDNAFCVSKPVKLTEENPDAEVELQFPPGKTLSGVVLDPDGHPLPSTELKPLFTIPPDHGFGLKSVFTDEQGRFGIENATPDLGDYVVEVNTPGLMAERLKLKFGSRPQTFHLKRGRSLAGRLVQAGTGYAIPGVQIRALDVGDFMVPALEAQTDAGGHFEFTSMGDDEYTFFTGEGAMKSEWKFHAKGQTDVVLAIKLYDWSKVKPRLPGTTP